VKIVAIAAGARHALAVDEEGNLWSWGWNYYGQAGLGDTASAAEPTMVTFPATDTSDDHSQVNRTTDIKITKVAAGEDFSLALDDQGQVWSFGRNDKYQTGASTGTDNVTTPAPVFGFGTSSAQFENTVNPYKLDEVVDIAAGGRHSVALTASGAVYTWGDNDHGQLGQGMNVPAAWQPRELLSGKNPDSSYNPAVENTDNMTDKYTFAHDHTVVAIAAGYTHTLILVDENTNEGDNGNVYAFGYNYWGSLGNGTQADAWFPTRVKTTQNTAGAAVDLEHIAGIAAAVSRWRIYSASSATSSGATSAAVSEGSAVSGASAVPQAVG
jgi:alpha-tubulin suppressor-like RCC1 family protein